MTDLFAPLALDHGAPMKNRFVLAPLTNQQSYADGRLSEQESRWLRMRAKGGFALTMTAAAHVQASGQGFPGQLGIFNEEHLEGLAKLAEQLRSAGSLSAVQLHHAGNRAPTDLVGQPVCPSDDPRSGARALTVREVEQLRDDFVVAAKRAERAGFDGVELHGAHGYILAEFLSSQINRRDDHYGGSLENRARIIFEILEGIRAETGPNFQVGLRLSPERFGLKLAEIRDVAAAAMLHGKIDYLDMSLWDVFKEPHEEIHQGQTLLSLFTNIPRGSTKLGAAGKIMNASDALAVLDAGCDFAVIGRGAILRHDFPNRVRADAGYRSPATPVDVQHLLDEGLSPDFVEYMRQFPGFVETAL